MPRPTAAPGKKENYNLDYQRFNKFDNDEDEQGEQVKRPGEADAAAGMPDVRDMLRTMPPELQEAFYLMQVAKSNGDTVAQQRASALALQAVQKGGPEVRAEFMKNVAKEMPEIAGKLSKDMVGDVGADATSLLQGLQNDQAVLQAAMKLGGLENEKDPTLKIDTLRDNMLEGQKATRTEMENLQKKQDELEKIKNPEDFFKFMAEEGMTQEDLQRIFSGDEQHMQSRFNETVEKTMSKGVEKDTTVKSADALKNVEELHSTLFGTEPEEAEAETPAIADKPKRRAPSPPKEPEVTIPMYRLQYQKDEAGKYTVVELKCTLPGVADMSAIDLDLSERHLRLFTHATDTAPRYAVNAGPFPVLIDPSRARAKYSKKREELSISVPAKAS